MSRVVYYACLCVLGIGGGSCAKTFEPIFISHFGETCMGPRKLDGLHIPHGKENFCGKNVPVNCNAPLVEFTVNYLPVLSS